MEEQPCLVPLAVAALREAVDCVREQVQSAFLVYAHPPAALPALRVYVHPPAALPAYAPPAVAYVPEACAPPVCAQASERDVLAATRRDDVRNGGDDGGGQVGDDDVLEHGACCVPECGVLDDGARACGVLDDDAPAYGASDGDALGCGLAADGVPAYGQLPAQAYGAV